MSHETVSFYEIEKARRRELYLQRIRENVERYLGIHRASYEEMLRRHYDSILPQEMQRFRMEIDRIAGLLSMGEIEAAHEISMSISRLRAEIHSLAREIREREFEVQQEIMRKEREAKKVKVNAVMQVYYDMVASIQSPVVASLASDELTKLKEKILSSSYSVEKVKKDILTTIEKATTDAEKWKQSVKQKRAKEIVSEELKKKLEESQANAELDKAKQEEFLQRIKALQEEADKGTKTAEEIRQAAEKVENEQLEETVNESVRKEAVLAIYKELVKLGFKVQPPRLEVDGCVYIRASKPAGNRVACKLSLNGKIQYRFDDYTGMSCMKDREKFNVDLERIYSVKLSDERVIWSNPDRMQRDAYGTVTTIGRTK